MVVGAFALQGYAADVDFAKSIQGVFEARCIDCHGSKKQKGDLRLDTLKAASSVIEPGKSGESDLVKRITLPADHEDVMPPKGDPLTKEQIDAIKAWIDGGAKWPDGVVLLSEKERAEAKAAASRLPTPDVKADPVSDAEKAAIAKLSSGEGIGDQAAAPLVMALAQDTQLIYANFRLIGKDVEDKHVAPLADIANLSELDLSNTKITGGALAHIKNSKKLTKLSLANTAVDDAALKNVEGLTNLMSINLYNTKVSDAGLANLKNMKFLRKVYGWKSQITEKGAAELKKTLPNVDVNLGFALAKVEPKKDEKKEGPDISEVMKKGFKGELVKDLAKNKATLEKYFQVLVKFKPSKGDADSWKTKTEALVAALKSGKQEDLNKASNCKACHSVHKP